MRSQQVFLFCLLAAAAACNLVSTVEANRPVKKTVVPKTDEEIEQEFKGWISRMGEKHKNKVRTKTTLGANYATTEADGDSTTIVVDKNGNGNFKSINKAIKSIPSGASKRYIIHVTAGTYKEHVKIPSGMGPLTLQGEGYSKTKITYDLDAGSAGGTLKSASVSVKSDNFIAKDIAFENSSPDPGPGAENKQAVALEISGDKAAFYRCAFYGFQDTLYDRYGRHYFKDCLIVGSIDYIFGDGQSYYETCQLQTIAQPGSGSLSAQKRMSSGEDTGYAFVNCRVEGTGDVFLGRSWGPFSRVVFAYTYLDKLIRPDGWYNWGDSSREKTSFYAEYKCYGPGASRSNRVYWSYELSEEQAQPFLSVDWIDGNEWLPQNQ